MNVNISIPVCDERVDTLDLNAFIAGDPGEENLIYLTISYFELWYGRELSHGVFRFIRKQSFITMISIILFI